MILMFYSYYIRSMNLNIILNGSYADEIARRDRHNVQVIKQGISILLMGCLGFLTATFIVCC